MICVSAAVGQWSMKSFAISVKTLDKETYYPDAPGEKTEEEAPKDKSLTET